ncbi:MAG: 30S ribosomal protein S25e [Acidilobus sp.]
MSSAAPEKKQPARQQPRPQAKAAGPTILEVTPDLVNRARREVAKMKYVTPYRLANAFGIKMSVARKLLRELIKQGVLEPRIKNRRLTVATPKRES